jgi:antitoxin (DNA-binding transcriptional repressor) of toxin-antitoxin stability system
MQTIELAEAQSRLLELVSSLAPGQEVLLAQNSKPVARLVAVVSTHPPRPLREFAGQFRPLPQTEMDDLKEHDRFWCDPRS